MSSLYADLYSASYPCPHCGKELFYIINWDRFRCADKECKGFEREQPTWEFCYQDPYVLDSPEKVEWANSLADFNRTGRRYRFGDSCHFRPCKP